MVEQLAASDGRVRSGLGARATVCVPRTSLCAPRSDWLVACRFVADGRRQRPEGDLEHGGLVVYELPLLRLNRLCFLLSFALWVGAKS